MKRSSSVKLLLMGSATFTLAACGDDPEPVGVFSSVQECIDSGVYTESYCQTSLEQARKDHVKVAPKYKDKAECEADFGVGRCENPQIASGGNSGGSVWMPLMMGYMVGKMMNNQPPYAQPLYRPNEYNNQSGYYGGSHFGYSAGSWRTASNVQVADRTGLTTVGGGSWRTTTPQTQTLSRGGFGTRAASIGVGG